MGPNKKLLHFEDCVFSGKLNAAFECLVEMCKELRGEGGGKFYFKGARRRIGEIYTRIAAATVVLMANPSLSFGKEHFLALCDSSETLHDVFEASGYAGTKVLLQVLSHPDEHGQRKFAEWALLRLWPMLSLDDIPEIQFALALHQPSDVLLPLAMAWLQQRTVLTAQGEANRTRLLEVVARLDASSFEPKLAKAMARVWMHCSYADAPDKHEIKRAINRMYVRWLTGSGADLPCSARHVVVRPTLLVVGEHFNSGHPMHRCYAPAIRALGVKFHLVLITTKAQYDAESAAFFDEVIEMPNGTVEAADLLHKVLMLAPDMIYYPSVGMTIWGIFLANLRLAPIQLMSGGHPATSMSDHMDYYLLPRGMQVYPGIYSEVLIWLKGNLPHEKHHLLPPGVRARRATAGEPINVAINSKSMKLSHRLLDICIRLEKASTRKLHFHFFPGETGALYDSLQARLCERFPSAIVHSVLPYDEFMATLAQCDLSLAAFPFGNANGTVDACLLGLPVVAHSGPQPHSLTDTRVMTTVGLPEWLICDNDEDYFKTALRLIEDDASRFGIVDYLEHCDVAARLFGDDDPTALDHFVEAFTWIYENHEQIQQSGKRIINAGEL